MTATHDPWPQAWAANTIREKRGKSTTIAVMAATHSNSRFAAPPTRDGGARNQATYRAAFETATAPQIRFDLSLERLPNSLDAREVLALRVTPAEATMVAPRAACYVGVWRLFGLDGIVRNSESCSDRVSALTQRAR